MDPITIVFAAVGGFIAYSIFKKSVRRKKPDPTGTHGTSALATNKEIKAARLIGAEPGEGIRLGITRITGLGFHEEFSMKGAPSIFKLARAEETVLPCTQCKKYFSLPPFEEEKDPFLLHGHHVVCGEKSSKQAFRIYREKVRNSDI